MNLTEAEADLFLAKVDNFALLIGQASVNFHKREPFDQLLYEASELRMQLDMELRGIDGTKEFMNTFKSIIGKLKE